MLGTGAEGVVDIMSGALSSRLGVPRPEMQSQKPAASLLGPWPMLSLGTQPQPLLTIISF